MEAEKMTLQDLLDALSQMGISIFIAAMRFTTFFYEPIGPISETEKKDAILTKAMATKLIYGFNASTIVLAIIAAGFAFRAMMGLTDQIQRALRVSRVFMRLTLMSMLFTVATMMFYVHKSCELSKFMGLG